MTFGLHKATVLELCCFEWFQNNVLGVLIWFPCFRAVLFRMVPKPMNLNIVNAWGFRAVLFRMVPKPLLNQFDSMLSFRAVLFRMVPKLDKIENLATYRFRAVLFRMVPKHEKILTSSLVVLELCCFEWFQN